MQKIRFFFRKQEIKVESSKEKFIFLENTIVTVKK